jgi:rhomboid family GlyGly-CTERM serine protease
MARGVRHRRRVTRGARGWLAMTLALAAAAAMLWPAPRAMLDWQPARAFDEPWRVWSAAFVHWTPWHLGANLLGCAVVAAFGVAARVPVRAAVAWLVAWPLSHAALALQPALTHYGGLSGVLHAGVAIAAWHLLRHDSGTRRAIGIAVMAGLAVKLLLEEPWGAPTQQVAGWDFAVAPLAHASGAIAGIVCAAIGDAVMKVRS